jgi:hypothetical protein
MNDTAEKAREKAQGLSQAHKERAKGLAREAREKGRGSSDGPPGHAKAYGRRGTRPEGRESTRERVTAAAAKEGITSREQAMERARSTPRDEIKERIASMRAGRGRD